MKQIMTIVVIMLCAFRPGMAQSSKKVFALASLGTYLNHNQGDVATLSGNIQNLTVKNKLSYLPSLGIMLRPKPRFSVLATAGRLFQPDEIAVINPDDGSIYKERFVSQYLTLRFVAGTSLAVGKNAIDIGAGFVNNLSLNKKLESTKVFLKEETTGFNTISHTVQTNWGNNAAPDLMPSFFQGEIQVAYNNRSILPNSKMLRIALIANMGLPFREKRYSNYDNSAQVNYYDDNGSERKLIGSELFYERHLRTRIELSIGI